MGLVKDLVFLESIIKMPLMELPVRTVLVNIGESKVLISPGSKLTRTQLLSLGQVTDIVAPNLWHTAGILLAAQVFPEARIWGVDGCDDRRPEIKWTTRLTAETWKFSEVLKPIFIEGMPKVNEVVFFHVPTNSLIVTDLFFNLVHSKGLGARLILTLFGTYSRFGISKFFIRFIKDHEKTRTSFETLQSFDVEQIVVSHGENVIQNANALIKKALAERRF